MAPKEPKTSKQAAAGITRHITFTNPATLEKFRKHVSATIQSVNMAACKIGLLTIYGIKETQGKNYM
jgi:hypothetical protein